MSLAEQLRSDFTAAQRSHDALRSSVLRLVFAAIQNYVIERRSKRARSGDAGADDAVSDDEVLAVLVKEAKKRKESIALFTQGSRNDLVAKETAELAVLEAYLPKPLTPEELMTIVRDVVDTASETERAQFGKLMGAVIQRTEGRAEASEVSRLLKTALGA